MILLRLYLSWITDDDKKSKGQEKHVKLCSNFNLLLSHETKSLFQRSLYHFQASKLSPRAILSLLLFKKDY